MAKLLLGLPVADALTEALSQRVEELAKRGVTPTLAIVRVGERDDDLSYERGALKRCAKVGIAVRQFVLPADCSQEELMAVIDEVNTDATINGCLMFRPLPKTLDEAAACAALDPRTLTASLRAHSMASLPTVPSALLPARPRPASRCLTTMVTTLRVLASLWWVEASSSASR